MTDKIQLRISPARPSMALQTVRGQAVRLEIASVLVGNPGPPGAPGPAAAEPDYNSAETDMTAYYILARS